MGMTDKELSEYKETMRPDALAKLETWDIETQKRWVANPRIEFCIQNYMNDLLKGCRSQATPAPILEAVPEPIPTPAPTSESDDDDNNGVGNMFSLFDS